MGPSVVQNTKKERSIFHLKEFENEKIGRGRGWRGRMSKNDFVFEYFSIEQYTGLL